MNLIKLKAKLASLDILLGRETNYHNKILKDLLRQIRAGECRLVKIDHHWVRFMSSAIVTIRYRLNENVVYHLVEEYREHRSGRIVKCSRTDGIGIKIRRGETPRQAAMRCLKNKLQFRPPPKIVSRGEITETTITRGVHPCPIVRLRRCFFTCNLPDHLWNHEGYVRKRPHKKKTTTFRWIPMFES